jgi:hypothetical protein
MKLHWIGIAQVVLLSAPMLMGASATSPQRGTDSVSTNVWGGMHVRMELTPQGATLEFDCGHGSILEPVKPNAKGEFVARGTYTPEHGGPVIRDNPPRDLPAIYKGTINGETMQLEIILADKEQATLEPLRLTRGKHGRVVKCC